jgi:hypothetical protein
MRKTELVRGKTYKYSGIWAPGNIHSIGNYGAIRNLNEMTMRSCILTYLGTRDDVEGDVAGYSGEPIFEARSSNPNHRTFRFRCLNCGPIAPAGSGEGVTRKEKAEILRAAIEGHKSEIVKLEETVSTLKKRIASEERQANMFEKYDTDEEALAATFSKIIQTGGSEAEILEILKEFGVTDKL